MALSTKLLIRQGQSLVMTPQLLQAIKLLQFSNIELASFVQEELERNPLLERADDAGPVSEPVATGDHDPRVEADSSLGGEFNDGVEADWSSESFATDQGSLEASLGTELNNSFDSDRAPTPAEQPDPFAEAGLSANSWSGSGSPSNEGEGSNLESYIAARLTLREHLLEQLPLAVADPGDRLIGLALIDAIDDSGYLGESPGDIAERLGAPLSRVTEILEAIQTLDPVGVGARNLAECLTLQLRDRDRFDPAMEALVANLGMVARRDMAGLRKACGVDDEDIADMIAEIKRLDPKPGRAYGSSAIQPVVPDVNVRLAPDGSWTIELNTDVLPRLLVNQTYAARISRHKGSEADRSFVSGCLQTANWLTKSLEQRARTILKVSSEIVRQQDAFFAYGVEHLRPLNLKAIAEATGMHESTVSRVTSNKYMSSPRGLFELKYFFTASIASNDGGDSHSAESVRFRIKQMIERESASEILSDDAIVERLKSSNVDIARRTVAKYRESMRIPSSVERRRQKAVH
jgi:RNA polymerase sigma-54 factor